MAFHGCERPPTFNRFAKHTGSITISFNQVTESQDLIYHQRAVTVLGKLSATITKTTQPCSTQINNNTLYPSRHNYCLIFQKHNLFSPNTMISFCYTFRQPLPRILTASHFLRQQTNSSPHISVVMQIEFRALNIERLENYRFMNFHEGLDQRCQCSNTSMKLPLSHGKGLFLLQHADTRTRNRPKRSILKSRYTHIKSLPKNTCLSILPPLPILAVANHISQI